MTLAAPSTIDADRRPFPVGVNDRRRPAALPERVAFPPLTIRGCRVSITRTDAVYTAWVEAEGQIHSFTVEDATIGSFRDAAAEGLCLSRHGHDGRQGLAPVYDSCSGAL